VNVILTVKAPGHLKEVETTELHTVEVAMEGMRKANKESYQGPDSWRDAFSSLADVPPARPSE
jgi:hypothetical protein